MNHIKIKKGEKKKKIPCIKCKHPIDISEIELAAKITCEKCGAEFYVIREH